MELKIVEENGTITPLDTDYVRGDVYSRVLGQYVHEFGLYPASSIARASADRVQRLLLKAAIRPDATLTRTELTVASKTADLADKVALVSAARSHNVRDVGR